MFFFSVIGDVLVVQPSFIFSEQKNSTKEIELSLEHEYTGEKNGMKEVKREERIGKKNMGQFIWMVY